MNVLKMKITTDIDEDRDGGVRGRGCCNNNNKPSSSKAQQ